MRTGDFAQFGKGFADDAVLRFDGVPVGPFRGRTAIVDAYVTQPPLDTMALTSMEEIGGDAVRASFEWDEGGTGNMFLRWDGPAVVELVIAFD
ncbi:hypothetical protein GCM10009681_38900 [Luedemannella helvata]|uniref:Nuclear transport factor 2 family protein n=1 Tax=Luedemannella helvata TaxID=349315 RepID=A0ABP4WZE6_9ACTN